MHQSVIDKLPDFLRQYEGKVNFMYLDVKGLVTIGIGNLIDPVDQALKLEFGTKGGGSPVGSGEVIAEWNTVKARKDLVNQGSPAFNAITRLQLTDRGITTMVNSAAQAIETYITTNASAQKFYANFKNWPADAQLGFLGVAWGGIPLPQFGWHKFPVACQNEDWDTAAKECTITSAIAAGRNEAHKLMFSNAAAVKSNGDPITMLCWPNRQGRTTQGNVW
jgi:GH24 family phage-related lysozyme (muramidase)